MKLFIVILFIFISQSVFGKENIYYCIDEKVVGFLPVKTINFKNLILKDSPLKLI